MVSPTLKAIFKVDKVAQSDISRHNRRGGVADIEVCPQINVLFVLNNGKLDLYDMENLTFISTVGKLKPGVGSFTHRVDSTRVTVCVARARRIFVFTSKVTDTNFRFVHELFVPSPALTLAWFMEDRLCVGFLKVPSITRRLGSVSAIDPLY